jgi:hypothetical protein
MVQSAKLLVIDEVDRRLGSKSSEPDLERRELALRFIEAVILGFPTSLSQRQRCDGSIPDAFLFGRLLAPPQPEVSWPGRAQPRPPPSGPELLRSGNLLRTALVGLTQDATHARRLLPRVTIAALPLNSWSTWACRQAQAVVWRSTRLPGNKKPAPMGGF